MGVQNERTGCPKWKNEVLIPQLRDQSEDWAGSKVVKTECWRLSKMYRTGVQNGGDNGKLKVES